MPRQKTRKFWQTSQFKSLQKVWEQKLRDSGFKDAEADGKLRQNAANSYRTKELAVIESKQSYYEVLGQKYHEEQFKDQVDAYVIERRSQGVSLIQIRQELKSQGKKNGRETIRKIIRFYERKWRIAKKRA